MNTAQLYGQPAQRVLRQLQRTLDTLPDGHPAMPHLLAAVTVAAIQWRAAEAGAGQGEPAAKQSAGQGVAGAPGVF